MDKKPAVRACASLSRLAPTATWRHTTFQLLSPPPPSLDDDDKSSSPKGTQLMRVFSLGLCVSLAASLHGKLGWARKLMYIKLPMYLFIYCIWRLDSMILMQAPKLFLAQMCVWGILNVLYLWLLRADHLVKKVSERQNCGFRILKIFHRNGITDSPTLPLAWTALGSPS